MMLGFSDGSNSNWVTPDQNGVQLNDDTSQNAWHYRRVDLGPHIGKTLVGISLLAENDTAPGNWQLDFNEIVIVSADGTVRPSYVRQTGVSLTVDASSGMSGVGYGIGHDASLPNAQNPINTTTYYHSDHLGSSRVLSSTFGYPVWQGTYLPFGQEWNPQSTVNAYKFTGKERDSETGLDYFGARYYGSTMGRFLSVDPLLSTLRPENPQTLNRYAYTLNNPLRYTDPTGKYEEDVHRDLTTVLAMAAGFDADTAAAIGEADNRIDTGSTRFALSDYHFTTAERRDALWNQFEKSGSISDLGAFLHPEQDSYSHAGLNPATHALKSTAPDKTYNDPGKADNMAKDTYQRLSAAAQRLGITPNNQVAWSKIDKLVGDFNKAKTKADKDKILGQLRDVISKAQQEQQQKNKPKKKEQEAQ